MLAQPPTLEPPATPRVAGFGPMQSVLDHRGSANTRPVALAKTKVDQPAASDMAALLTKLVLSNMPHQYADDKKWGHQEKRWDGVRIRREGLRVETKRRWKMVNHGTWQIKESSQEG